MIFDGGNTGPNIGPTLAVALWCQEVERLAALCPQATSLQLNGRSCRGLRPNLNNSRNDVVILWFSGVFLPHV